MRQLLCSARLVLKSAISTRAPLWTERLPAQVIITTDIFGRTDHLDVFAVLLARNGTPSTVVDPYEGVRRCFTEEAQAYEAFLEAGGHDRYASRLRSTMDTLAGPLVLVGFSAGATAAWICALDRQAGKVMHLVGFYPGRIRYHLNQIPPCPTTLIFPCREDHFNVDSVIRIVSQHEQVTCIKTKLFHGFMNPLSRNHNAAAASEYTATIAMPGLLDDHEGLRRRLKLKAEA